MNETNGLHVCHSRSSARNRCASCTYVRIAFVKMRSLVETERCQCVTSNENNKRRTESTFDLFAVLYRSIDRRSTEHVFDSLLSSVCCHRKQIKDEPDRLRFTLGYVRCCSLSMGKNGDAMAAGGLGQVALGRVVVVVGTNVLYRERLSHIINESRNDE
jgi:hypothetical protein